MACSSPFPNPVRVVTRSKGGKIQFPLLYNSILLRISREPKVIQSIKAVEGKNVGSRKTVRFYLRCPRFSSALCHFTATTEATVSLFPFLYLSHISLTAVTLKGPYPPALPGNLLEMQINSLYPRLRIRNSGVGPSNLCCNKSTK